MTPLHFVLYSENNIPESCPGAKLSKMRAPEKYVMINGTVTLEKSCPLDYDRNNGPEIKNQRSIFMWPNYVSLPTQYTQQIEENVFRILQ